MALQDDLDTPLAAAVRKAGSQGAFARIVGRSQPAIFRDLQLGKPVVLEEIPAIENALGISRHDLRPDYFGEAPPQPARHPAEQPPAQAPCSLGGDDAGGPTSASAAAGGRDPLEGLAA